MSSTFWDGTKTVTPLRGLAIAAGILLPAILSLWATPGHCQQPANGGPRPSSTVLMDRVERLENQNRLLMFGLVLVGVGLVIQIVMKSISSPDNTSSSQSSPVRTPAFDPADDSVEPADRIRTKRVEIVDGYGKTRGILGFNDDGTVGLGLLDKREKVLAEIVLDKDSQPSIALYDAQSARFTATIDSDSSVRLDVYRQDGQPGAELAVDSDGSPRLDLYDADAVARVELAVDRNDSPALDLYHRDDNTNASVTIDPEGKPALILTDENGSTIWSAP